MALVTDVSNEITSLAIKEHYICIQWSLTLGVMTID